MIGRGSRVGVDDIRSLPLNLLSLFLTSAPPELAVPAIKQPVKHSRQSLIG